MNTVDIAKIIVSRRHALNVTQVELARRADISRRTLIDLENSPGSNDIGFRKLERVLNALGLSIAITEETKRPIESELRSIFPDDE
jgi:transcriptional regulator with XRE-family HTH domain